LPAKKGTFTKPISPTNANTETVDFEPRAVILWSDHGTADGFLGNARLAYGFSDGTRHRSFVFNDRDGVPAGNNHAWFRYSTATALQFTNIINNAIIAQCTVAFAPNGPNWDVNFTWTTNNNAGYLIHYLILGGATMRARVGSAAIAALGTQNITIGWGLGQPDALLTFSPPSVFGDVTTSGNPALASLGFGSGPASAPTNRFSMLRADNAESLTDTWRSQGSTLITRRTSTTAGVDLEARLLAGTWPGDGFALDVATFVVNTPFAYLALKYVDVAVGTDTALVTAGAKTTALPFSPEAILLMSMCTGFSGSAQRATLDFGAASGVTLEGGTWLRSQTGVSTTVCDSNSHSTNILELADNSTPVVNATANVTAMTAGFELTWSGTLSVSYQFNYLALRETGAGNTPVSPDFLASSPTVYALANITKDMPVAPTFLLSSPTVYAPTLALDNPVAPALLANSPTVYAPTIALDIGVLPALLLNAPTVYAPAVPPPGVTDTPVLPALLENVPTVYAPTITLAKSFAVFALFNAPTVYTPTVIADVGLAPALLSNTPTVYALSQVALAIAVDAALLLNTPTVYAPTVLVAGQTETWTQAGERTHLINPANHPSSTVYELDGVLWSSAEGNPAKMRLMYLVGAVWTLVPGAPTLVSTVVSSDPPSVTGVPARVRSAAFALVAGAQEYRFERSHIPGAIHNYEDAAIRGSG